MIVKTFDNGWGLEYPTKQFEKHLLDQYLKPVINDKSRTVLINCVWYSREYHQQVLTWLKQNSLDRIVLVAMIDPAIPYPEWYNEIGVPVNAVGYYTGPDTLDYWALLLAHYHKPVPVEVLLDFSKIDIAYMCLNRKPHWHRRQLYKKLQNKDLVQHGLVSMGDQLNLVNDRTQDNLAPNSDQTQYGIPNDLVSLGNPDNWTRCLVNVVTETVYNINQNNFISEKIFKPMVGHKPFLVYDTDGACAWLRNRGFEPYVQDFKDITDLDLSMPDHLIGFLGILCQQPKNYWQHKFLELRNKLIYNKNQFDQYVQDQKNKLIQAMAC